MKMTVSLQDFMLTDEERASRELLSLVCAEGQDKQAKRAFWLDIAIDELAHKCEAIDDGRSKGFWLTDAFAQQVFDILKAAGMALAVRREGEHLLRPAT